MSAFTFTRITTFLFFLAKVDGATIFNNFGSDDLPFGAGSSIQWEQSFGGKGESQVTGQAVAMRFSVTAGDFYLDSITLALWQVRGVPNLKISIANDVGGIPSQSRLEILAFNPTSIPSSALALTFASSNRPTLSSGTDYWVVVEPADLNSSDPSNNAAYGWAKNTLNETGSYLYRSPQSSGAWGSWIPTSSVGSQPSLKVDASVIPEPRLMLMFCISISCSLILRRRPLHTHSKNEEAEQDETQQPPLAALSSASPVI